MKIIMNSTTCRICLNNTATVSIFDRRDDIQYYAQIMRCASVEIAEGDGLPTCMCESCCQELQVAYEFVLRCEASDGALRCLGLQDLLEEDLETKDLIKDDDDKFHESILANVNGSRDEYSFNKSDSFCEKLFVNDDILFKKEEENSAFDNNEFDLKQEGNECILDTEESDAMKGIKRKNNSKYKRNKLRRKTGPIQCVVCGLMTSSRSAMEIHMRTHTGEKPFNCQECDSKFPTKGSLKRHIETHHGLREKKFVCEACGSSFFTKNDIITHLRVHTDERPYCCTYCSKRFRQIASLIRHRRIHTGEKPFSCSICNRSFSDKSLMKKHQLVHSNEKNFTCHICSKSMKSKNSLNIHIACHKNEKQHVCSVCGVGFLMKGNLKTHMKRMHSEKSGQCPLCLKTFSDLPVHMRKHTGEKPFTCGICNQGFSMKRSLTHHVAFKHENSTKFKCSIGECAKTFPTATMLEFHFLKQHTNHTPYICQHCSRGFFRVSDLTRHLKVSHIDTSSKVLLKPLPKVDIFIPSTQ